MPPLPPNLEQWVALSTTLTVVGMLKHAMHNV